MGRRLSHLHEAGETYFEHLRFAWSVGFVMIVHGLLPWIGVQSIRHDGERDIDVVKRYDGVEQVTND